ncbi:MAG TPA: hypothetical protein VK559_08660, partial [Ferruginibacter sp.]|nr:hypothetical protein [Ferruginibacter sp.]
FPAEYSYSIIKVCNFFSLRSLIAAGLCSFSSAPLATDENLLRMILSACALLGTLAKEALP